MTIREERKDGTLTVFLEGRLDTTTSPELETFLDKIYPSLYEIIFDFEKLDYISSAGLRVVLKAQKMLSERGGIRIRNASKLVMSVFEVTGFSDILRIE